MLKKHFQKQVQTKSCRHKDCPYGKQEQAVEKFYKFKATNVTTSKYDSYKDGYDFYCIVCRRRYQNHYNRKSIFKEAIQYWQKLSTDPRNVRLDKLMIGFANFDMHVSPVPLLTYNYLAHVHKAKWPVYVNAFNYLYAYKYLCIEPPIIFSRIASNAEDIYMEKEILERKLIDRKLLTMDDIPVGMHDILNIMRGIRSQIRYFTGIKRCVKCGITKQTYHNPIPHLEDEPLTDEYYVQTVYMSQMKRLQNIRPYYFAKSYQSADGWKQKCVECSEQKS